MPVDGRAPRAAPTREVVVTTTALACATTSSYLVEPLCVLTGPA